MILSGRQITEQIHEGGITIDPFDPSLVGPNSCNLRLHDTLLRYADGTLDMAKRNPTESLEIPKNGIMLLPGELYLGRTVERTVTDRFVPMIEGRSSVGRLGIFVHVTAGFGDIGFSGTWTLEIAVIRPVIIYPFIPICQLYFHTIEGEFDLYKSKKYQGQRQIIPSRLWKDITRIPSTFFFDTMERKFEAMLVEMGKSSSVSSLKFRVALADNPDLFSSNPCGVEGLEEYVFECYIDASYSFPRKALVEFYAEIPCCLAAAMLTIQGGDHVKTIIEVQ